MISFLAIVKLTYRAALRSYIFHLLLFTLILSIIIIPHTVIDDGTARGFIRVSLQYSMAAINFILSMSTIWVSCFILSRDIESLQIHMIVTKPVPRLKIWIAKWFGVAVIHIVLLMLSSILVYFMIIYKFHHKDFSSKDRIRIQNEVFTARRVYMPEIPDIDSKVREEYNRRVAVAGFSELYKTKPAYDKYNFIRDIRKEILAKLGEVRPGVSNTRTWNYKGLQPDKNNLLFLRYKAYIDNISSKDHRETAGIWQAEMHIPKNMIDIEDDMEQKDKKQNEEPQDEKNLELKTLNVSLSPYPEKFMSGVFNELVLPPPVIGGDGRATISFINCDMQNSPVFFQISDGPKLLVKAAGFFENYLRGVLIIMINLLFLAGLGCAAGGFLSMPTAVFFVISYLLFGVFSSYLLDLKTIYEDVPETKFSLENISDYVGEKVSKVLIFCTVPVQKLGVSETLADGELIENEFIAKTFFSYFILRGIPIFLLGILIYSKREMGSVIQK